MEILNSKLFRKKSSTLKKIEREHVTKFYYNNHSKYKIYNKTFPKNLSKINLSIDTNLDLRNIKRKIKFKVIKKTGKIIFNMDRIIFGVAGLGVGAFHLQNLLKSKSFCETMCDFDKKKLFLSTKHKIRNITENVNDIINDKEINAIVIATNDNFHCEQILEPSKINTYLLKNQFA